MRKCSCRTNGCGRPGRHLGFSRQKAVVKGCRVSGTVSLRIITETVPDTRQLDVRSACWTVGAVHSSGLSSCARTVASEKRSRKFHHRLFWRHAFWFLQRLDLLALLT